jgi:hypothetical protein
MMPVFHGVLQNDTDSQKTVWARAVPRRNRKNLANGSAINASGFFVACAPVTSKMQAEKSKFEVRAVGYRFTPGVPGFEKTAGNMPGGLPGSRQSCTFFHCTSQSQSRDSKGLWCFRKTNA